MSIFKTAYDTTACKDMQIEKIRNGILEAKAQYELYDGELPNTYLVKKNRNAIATLPSFAHPMAVHFRGDDKDSLVADIRDLVRQDPQTADYKIVESSDHTLALARLALNAIWLTETGVYALRDMPILATQVYAAWVSQTVGNRLGLDPGERLKMAMYAAYFYSTLFIEKNKEMTSRDTLKFTNALTQATKCSSNDAMAFIDEVSQHQINNLHDFCRMAEPIVGTVRLREMNAGWLISVVGGTWWGANARELTAVALEHPPTWVALLMMAVGAKKYKNALLSKIAEVWAKGQSGTNYIHSVQSLTKTSIS
jgi:hypothetical protein